MDKLLNTEKKIRVLLDIRKDIIIGRKRERWRKGKRDRREEKRDWKQENVRMIEIVEIERR